MGEWPIIRLEDLSASAPGSIAIGPFGSRMKADRYVERGVPVIRGTNISESRGWKGDWVYVSDETADSMPNCNVREGDLVFPHRGSIGEVAIVPGDMSRYMLSTSLMKFSADRSSTDPVFLFYYFRSPMGRHQILSFSSQVGTPGIGQPLSSLRQFRVPCPPLRVQQAIGETLSSLDDKIELNGRVNETLEAMARAIFKDWFVDFGPTRAKAEGQKPYLSENLWSLFPDSVDGEDKPEGWKSGELGDVAGSPRRGVSPSEVSEDTPYIGLEHMPRHSIALAEWDSAGKVTSNKSAFQQGEFLFGKLRPYFHKVGIAPVGGICSTDIVVVSAAAEWRALVLSCISRADFVAYTDRTSTGTKMPRTSWRTMSRYPIVLPDVEVARAYSELTSPVFDQISVNIHESRVLGALRDLLVPKLTSGEIRVDQAEKAVEEVA